jgi:hypothetical protein
MTDPELRELLDKQAIHEQLARYCRGVDRADAEMISATYHRDAVDEHGDHRFAGDAIGTGIVELTRSMRVTLHALTNVVIEFHDSDRAACESYFSAWQTVDLDGEERLVAALGRYLDRFERRDGEWRVAHRLVLVDLTEVLPAPGFGPSRPSRPSLGRRDRDDPSYDLFDDR